MALQDILEAITAEADRKISEARAAHQKNLSDMRDSSAENVRQKRKEITEQKEQKLLQMRRKAETHAEMLKRNKVLSAKHDLLDKLFADVTKKISSLPEKEIEPLLRSLLKSIKVKGEIRPTKHHKDLLTKLAPSEQFEIGSTVEGEGGFVFVGSKEEADLRIDSLVESVLRPESELSAITSLFGTAQ